MSYRPSGKARATHKTDNERQAAIEASMDVERDEALGRKVECTSKWRASAYFTPSLVAQAGSGVTPTK